MSQVNNFIKRQKEHNFHEGCGCCWEQQNYRFDNTNNRVLFVSYGEDKGSYFVKATVLGKLRRKK
jgi:hypothetical protein